MAKDIPQKIRDIVQERATPVWSNVPLCEVNAPGCATVGHHWHHRKLRSQGGEHTPENGLMVCDPCHRYIHGKTEWAYMNGWLVHGSHDPETEPVVRRHQGAYLMQDGTVREMDKTETVEKDGDMEWRAIRYLRTI